MAAGQVALLRIRNRVRRRLVPPAAGSEAEEPSGTRTDRSPSRRSRGGGPDQVADDDEVIDLRDPVVIRPSEKGEVGGEPDMEDAVIDAAVDWGSSGRRLAAAALRSVILHVEVLDLATQPSEVTAEQR